MARKRVINKKKVRGLIIVVLVIVLIALAVKFMFFNKSTKHNVVKQEDDIKEYGYVLNDNETKYYKGLFNDLKKVLSEDEVDYDKYASLVAQLFVADFYNLDNKLNNNDIGGTQFIYKKRQSVFEKKAKDEVYKYVENNIYNDRKQELPEVSNVEVVSSENSSHTYLSKSDDKAYKIDVKITYKKDLGYPDSCSLVLVHNDKKLEIVKFN